MTDRKAKVVGSKQLVFAMQMYRVTGNFPRRTPSISLGP